MDLQIPKITTFLKVLTDNYYTLLRVSKTLDAVAEKLLV
jgi:hypothetical protein